jgi:hypothetical protein
MEKKAHNRVEMIGLSFNRLKVIDIDHKKGKLIFYRCSCSCGNLTVVDGKFLRNGKTKSCGCLKKEVSGESIKQLRIPRTGEAAYNKLYRDYRYGAKDRNYNFELTMDEFKKLIHSNCYYCLSEPNKIRKVYYNDEYITYNGIDRVNNNIGYNVDNCVPCCTMCNQAKHNHTKQVFKEWLIKIIKNIDNI